MFVIALDLVLFCVLFTIPTHVLLSMWMGVGGCGWPNSWRVSLIIFASWALKNKAPNSASAAEAATNFKMVQSTWIAPLILMGWLSWGMSARKKYPPALERALLALWKEASKWTFSTILEALYLMMASGLVAM